MRCLIPGCGAVRPAGRIVLHVYMAHRDWWEQRYGPRPPAVTV